jgi:acyl-CoA synthetase (AMP-forming)/AMP-acid ligase II
MAAMNALPALTILLLGAILVGCSMAPVPRSDTSTRVRCLSDAGRGALDTVTDRPLIFLFCAQSP